MNRGEHGIQCMPCSSRIVSEMLLEIHKMEKCHFLKSIKFILKQFNSSNQTFFVCVFFFFALYNILIDN